MSPTSWRRRCAKPSTGCSIPAWPTLCTRARATLILQVVEHIPAGIPSLEKIEGRLSQRIFMERMRPKLREFLSQLRREAFVEVKRGYVDSGAVEPPPKPILRGKRRRRIRGEN